MKTKILSNKKLFVFVGIVVGLFLAVNIAWWINANADQSDNGRTIYKGHLISSDKYEFVQGVNLPDIYLDSEHQPDYIENHAYKTLHVEEDNIAWLKVKSEHPWIDSTFYYGGTGDEGTSEYRFQDFEFVVSDTLEDSIDEYKHNRIGVLYDKYSPKNKEPQGARFYFKLDCYDENGNYIATKRTWDGFKDVCDGIDNSDVLERAGHSEEHGDLFDDALGLVGYHTLCNAVKDGRIKISVEKIVLEQNVSDTVVYKGRHIEGGGGDKYEFVQGVNMPDICLDADHYPEEPDHQYWDCFSFATYRAISWDSNDNNDHPWTHAEFWYGGNDDVGNSKYRFSHLEFIVSKYLEHWEADTGYIGIKYDKDSPFSLKTEQGMELFFKIDCYDENGNYLETKRTRDGFRDMNDTSCNYDVLQRAGHVKERGDYFKDALDLVGYDEMYFAIKDGRIKISIERIVMEQDDDS